MRIGRSARVYEYHPVGLDLFMANDPVPAGTLVRKTQPPGCPRNGTMGHCYIETLDGRFIGLRLVNSLTLVRRT